MLYLVVAHDGTDAGAQERRKAVRESHLGGAKALFDGGQMLTGGALLDADGAMIGSALILEAESEEAARQIVERDIYTTGGVWVRYDIWPYKKAF